MTKIEYNFFKINANDISNHYTLIRDEEFSNWDFLKFKCEVIFTESITKASLYKFLKWNEILKIQIYDDYIYDDYDLHWVQNIYSIMQNILIHIKYRLFIEIWTCIKKLWSGRDHNIYKQQKYYLIHHSAYS